MKTTYPTLSNSRRSRAAGKGAGALVLLFFSTAALAAPGGSGAMNASAQPESGRAAVRLAPDNASDSDVRTLAGQHVDSSDHQDLGTVKNFIVDANSGRVLYGVVSTGGFIGIGNTLHLVPAAALDHTPGREGFTARISKAQWDQVPALNEENYEEGRVTVNDADRQTMKQLFSVSDNAWGQENGGSMNLMRASDIRGKAIQNGGSDVGNIEHVVIDLDRRTAEALVDPNSDFTGSSRKVLVPVADLNIRSREQDPVTTQLTRADFQNARYESTQGSAASMNSSSGGSYAANDTDRNGNLNSAASSVRSALRGDSVLASENVQVVPQDGKLVLRGTVQSNQIRDRVESTAKRATNTGIDDQIKVGSE